MNGTTLKRRKSDPTPLYSSHNLPKILPEIPAPKTSTSSSEPLLVTLTEGHRLIQVLNPSAVLSRISAWRRGDLPGGAGDGRRGANSALPGFDKFDRRLKDIRRDYVKHIRAGVAEFHAAYLLQAELMEVWKPMHEEDPHPCSVVACDRDLNDEGRKSGKCGRCRKFFHDHGFDWSPRAEAKSAARS